MSPPSWAAQNALGLPQKSAPCGQADPGTPAVPSNQVTTYQEGQTITITTNEVVFHPGHYRVAIAATQNDLPADPPVTAGAQACGTTVITKNPTLPLLADDLFDHTTQFTTPQSAQITLPKGFTCTNCTLQVIEFMSDHGLNVPGGCFYHHCANVTIQPQKVMDAGTGGNDAATTTPDQRAEDGSMPTPVATGGCAVSTGRAAAGPFSLLAILLPLGALFARRRRRA